MNTDEFIDLVRRMRARQKAYFKTRDATVLRESKDLEARTDQAIEEMTRPPGLFDSAEEHDK